MANNDKHIWKVALHYIGSEEISYARNIFYFSVDDYNSIIKIWNTEYSQMFNS